jgi:hypothetical protein
MLYLDSNSLEINNARIQHWNFFSCRVYKKLTGVNCLNAKCKICSSTNFHNYKSSINIQIRLVNYLSNCLLEKII